MIRVLLLVIAPTTLALSILSPPNLACNVTTTIFNKRLGSQLLPDPSPVVLTHQPFKSCSEKTPPLVPGTFVLLTLLSIVPMHDLEAVARCWQSKGGSGLVVVLKDLHVPGYSLNIWDKKMRFDVTIPVLNAADSKCIDDVVAELKHNPSTVVTILPSVAETIWGDEFVKTMHFFVSFRVLMPALGVVVAVIALDSVIGHIMLLKKGTNAPTSSTIALIGSCGIFASGCFRTVYFILDPFRTTTRLSFEIHEFLFSSILGTTAFASFTATALLHHWTHAGLPVKVPLLVEGSLIFGAVHQLVLAWVFVLWQIECKRVGSIPIEVLGWIMTLIGTIFTSTSFLFAGRSFLKRLGAQQFSKSEWRNKALKKAVLWIMTAGAAQILILIGCILLISSADIRYTPSGLLWAFSFLFYGFSFTGIAHALSFRPISADSYSFLRITNWLQRQESPTSNATTWTSATANVIMCLEDDPSIESDLKDLPHRSDSLQFE